MRLTNPLAFAASMAAALRANLIGDRVGVEYSPPRPRPTEPPAPLPPKRRAVPRTEQQDVIQSMTNWQNHQWMKAGSPMKLADLRRFAAMKMGDAA